MVSFTNLLTKLATEAIHRVLRYIEWTLVLEYPLLIWSALYKFLFGYFESCINLLLTCIDKICKNADQLHIDAWF